MWQVLDFGFSNRRNSCITLYPYYQSLLHKIIMGIATLLHHILKLGIVLESDVAVVWPFLMALSCCLNAIRYCIGCRERTPSSMRFTFTTSRNC